METNKKLQNLIWKIIGKEYFKLEFGCKVKLNESDGEYIFIGSNVKDYPYCFYSKNTNTIINTNYILEILGQEPTLNDVLLCLKYKDYLIDGDGWFVENVEVSNIEYTENVLKRRFQYNLSKSIFNQSEEVKVAIINLLEDK